MKTKYLYNLPKCHWSNKHFYDTDHVIPFVQMVRCSYSIDAHDASVLSCCKLSRVRFNHTRSGAAVLHALCGSACAPGHWYSECSSICGM